MTEELQTAIEALNELKDDNTVPRNVKHRVEVAIATLSQETEVSIKVNKALSEMEELADDVNMQPYTRMQIFNVVSLLETVK